MFDRKENTNEDPINVQQTRRRLADGRVLPGTVCERSAGGVASHAIPMPSRNGGINYTFKFHLLTKWNLSKSLFTYLHIYIQRKEINWNFMYFLLKFGMAGANQNVNS